MATTLPSISVSPQRGRRAKKSRVRRAHAGTLPEIEDYGAREPSKHEKAAARRLALAQTHPGFREKKRERGTLGGPRELLANPVDTSGSRGFLRRGEKKRGVQRPPIDQELRHTKDGDRYVSWNPLSNTMYVRIPERCVAAEPAASLFYPPVAVAKAESVDYVDPKQKLKEMVNKWEMKQIKKIYV